MFDVSQVRRFENKLRVIPDIEEEWSRKWSGEAAERMRSSAPVDTGRLRASISAAEGGVAIGADYWKYVEYGTSDTPSKPFVVPTINRLKKPAVEDAGKRAIASLTR